MKFSKLAILSLLAGCTSLEQNNTPRQYHEEIKPTIEYRLKIQKYQNSVRAAIIDLEQVPDYIQRIGNMQITKNI